MKPYTPSLNSLIDPIEPTQDEEQNMGFVPKVPSYFDLYEIARNTDVYSLFYDSEYLTLKKIRYMFEHYVPRYLKREAINSYSTNEIHERFSCAVWGMENKPVTIKYPKNWWEAFKEQCLPSVFTERFPVKYTTIEINSQTLYPMLDIETPNLTHTIVYETNYKP